MRLGWFQDMMVFMVGVFALLMGLAGIIAHEPGGEFVKRVLLFLLGIVFVAFACLEED